MMQIKSTLLAVPLLALTAYGQQSKFDFPCGEGAANQAACYAAGSTAQCVAWQAQPIYEPTNPIQRYYCGWQGANCLLSDNTNGGIASAGLTCDFGFCQDNGLGNGNGTCVGELGQTCSRAGSSLGNCLGQLICGTDNVCGGVNANCTVASNGQYYTDCRLGLTCVADAPGSPNGNCLAAVPSTTSATSTIASTSVSTSVVTTSPATTSAASTSVVSTTSISTGIITSSSVVTTAPGSTTVPTTAPGTTTASTTQGPSTISNFAVTSTLAPVVTTINGQQVTVSFVEVITGFTNGQPFTITTVVPAQTTIPPPTTPVGPTATIGPSARARRRNIAAQAQRRNAVY